LSHIENVETKFGDLKYMRSSEATLLREFIAEHAAEDILEIGFYHGKSSAYFAAILEDLERGHLLTIDLRNARQRTPNIEQVLSTLNLSHRVTPVFVERSYTWELAKMIQATPRPAFDLCYFDGGHTWDATGFGFLLVDMLLRPGGWIIFDDLEWTIQKAMAGRTNVPAHWRKCSDDERAAPAVRMVFDLLVPHLGYTNLKVVNEGRWGIAQKPEPGAQPSNSTGDGSWFRKLLEIR
jgi:predicted O-methyltransferase YrrM